MAIFPVYYFPPISWFGAALHERTFFLEGWQFYRKQELFNRCRILTSNKVLQLIIPVERIGERIPVSKSRISYSVNWEKLHWRSIESAYRSSPFFEYYENRFLSLFDLHPENLFHHNLLGIELISEILDLGLSWEFSKAFNEPGSELPDYRFEFDPVGKKIPGFFNPEPYTQVFGEFIPDLSILDLLFNLGPESISYLERNFRPE